MRAAVVHRVVSAVRRSTRNGDRFLAEIEIVGEGRREYWMSIKQGEELIDCAYELKEGYSTKHMELHVVLDGDSDKERFVWCGLHSGKKSDLPFLEERFGVKCESPYIGRQSAADLSGPDPLLIDE